jgi:hypothetical protein
MIDGGDDDDDDDDDYGLETQDDSSGEWCDVSQYAWPEKASRESRCE